MAIISSVNLIHAPGVCTYYTSLESRLVDPSLVIVNGCLLGEILYKAHTFPEMSHLELEPFRHTGSARKRGLKAPAATGPRPRLSRLRCHYSLSDTRNHNQLPNHGISALSYLSVPRNVLHYSRYVTQLFLAPG